MSKSNEIKYLVFDIESVPDAALIRRVKYSDQDMDDVSAVRRYQEEILNNSGGTTFFIPATFQYPVSICIAKVKEDFTIDELVSLDEPQFRPSEMTRLFWLGIENVYNKASIVSFNGRGFDIPLMEFMAFRYGFTAKRHFKDKFASRFSKKLFGDLIEDKWNKKLIGLSASLPTEKEMLDIYAYILNFHSYNLFYNLDSYEQLSLWSLYCLLLYHQKSNLYDLLLHPK